jgi:cytochrome c biogenesis protein CcmG/thiol:disulfide interchange protein DsbE
MNWKILVAGIAICTPLVWVLATGFGHDPHAIPTVTLGSKASDFDLVDLSGQRVHLADLRGRPVVINFWATWCRPCVAEHAELQAAARTYQGRAVFLGILYGDDPALAREYLARVGSVYPTLVDPAQHTVVDYGVAGVPETFFLDGQGVIVHKVSGAVGAAELTAVLAELVR